MKKIGIIGGIGPESTVDYYRGIINAFKPDYAKNGYPGIVIESLNLKELLHYGDTGSWDRIADLLVTACQNLRSAGAEFGAIASNTPHHVFDDVQERTDLPLISIVESTCRYLSGINAGRVCLLGTKFTMKSDFYSRKLSALGIEVSIPDDGEIEFIHDKLMNEVEFGIVTDAARRGFVDIANRIVESEKIDAVVLACTELPLILKENDIHARYVDTVKIHVDDIVKRCRD